MACPRQSTLLNISLDMLRSHPLTESEGEVDVEE